MPYQPIFPAALQPAGLAMLRALPAAGLAKASHGFTVLVQGEMLCAPGRIHCAPEDLRSLVATSTGDCRALVLALGTRHADGHVREECLRQLVGIDRAWVVPFIVRLLGEYVLEIVELAAAAPARADIGQFASFALDNPQFMATTRRRATSYWACYHRGRFPALRTYPAIVALDAIERNLPASHGDAPPRS